MSNNTLAGQIMETNKKLKGDNEMLKGKMETLRSDRNAFIIVSAIFAALSLTLAARILEWI